jgi:hypothetical protein
MATAPGPNEALYLHKSTWRFEVVLEGRHLVALQRFTGGWFAVFIPASVIEAIGRVLNAARGSLSKTPQPSVRR